MLGWPGQSTCAYCGAALTRLQSGLGRCDEDVCKSRHINESHHQQYRQRWNAFVADQHKGAAAHGGEIVAGARALGSVPDQITVGIVPHLTRPMEPVPEARRAAFMAHLRTIIAESFAEPDPPTPNERRTQSESEDPAVSTAACIACLGNCCVLGAASNAFLRASSIDNVRRAQPDLDEDDIAEYYEAHIPDQIVEASCVFHGSLGCTLERTWRADMCNNFQCNAKRQALSRLDATGDEGMLWIATSNGSGRAMVHDAKGTREVTVEAADRGPAVAAAAVAAVRARLPRAVEERPVVVGPACRLCGSALPVGHKGTTCGSAACNLPGPS